MDEETNVSAEMPDIDSLVDSMGGEETQTETPAESPTPAAAAEPTPTSSQEPSEEPEPAPEDPRAQRGLAMLAERERALREQQEAWNKEREEVEADLEAFRAFKRKLEREDALGALNDLNISFDSLSRAVLEGKGVNPVSALEEQVTTQLTETERRIQERLEAVEARERQAQERAFRQSTRAIIEESSPLMAAWGDDAVEAVYQHYAALSQTHQGEQGSVPPISDVVATMQTELLSLIQKFKDVPEVQAIFSGTRTQPKPASPTLSNRQAATVPTRQTNDTDIDQFGTGDERIEAIVSKYL